MIRGFAGKAGKTNLPVQASTAPQPGSSHRLLHRCKRQCLHPARRGASTARAQGVRYRTVTAKMFEPGLQRKGNVLALMSRRQLKFKNLGAHSPVGCRSTRCGRIFFPGFTRSSNLCNHRRPKPGATHRHDREQLAAPHRPGHGRRLQRDHGPRRSRRPDRHPHAWRRQPGEQWRLCSDRPRPLADGGVVDSSAWSGIELYVFGNGEAQGVHLRTDALTRPWQSYRQIFTADAEWRTVQLPFDHFVPHRTDLLLDTHRLRRIGLVAIGRAFSSDLAVDGLRFMRLPRSVKEPSS
jgi:hypothetical protein